MVCVFFMWSYEFWWSKQQPRLPVQLYQRKMVVREPWAYHRNASDVNRLEISKSIYDIPGNSIRKSTAYWILLAPDIVNPSPVLRRSGDDGVSHIHPLSSLSRRIRRGASALVDVEILRRRLVWSPRHASRQKRRLHLLPRSTTRRSGKSKRSSSLAYRSLYV